MKGTDEPIIAITAVGADQKTVTVTRKIGGHMALKDIKETIVQLTGNSDSCADRIAVEFLFAIIEERDARIEMLERQRYEFVQALMARGE